MVEKQPPIEEAVDGENAAKEIELRAADKMEQDVHSEAETVGNVPRN